VTISSLNDPSSENPPELVIERELESQHLGSTLVVASHATYEALAHYTALGLQAEARKLMLRPSSHPEERYFQKHLQRLEETAQNNFMGSPTSHLLLTLVQFNVFRALLQNTCSIGLPFDWVHDYDAVSTIGLADVNIVGPNSSLQPTKLQFQVDHHPWIDMLPFPAMRDNMLRVYDKWAGEDDLCADVVGYCTTVGSRTGLIVWGEPWDPGSWEVTEDFLEHWAWLLLGCWELMQATNHFRKLRGEEPLNFEAAIRRSVAPHSP